MQNEPPEIPAGDIREHVMQTEAEASVALTEEFGHTDAPSERVVSMSIVNPDTGGKSRSFRYVGLVDLQPEAEVADWKGVADPDRFIKASRIGYQAERYALALLHEGKAIRKITYRLLTRPTIGYKRPKFTWAVKKVGRESAVGVFDSEPEAAALIREKLEKEGTADDARLAKWEEACKKADAKGKPNPDRPEPKTGEYSIEERASGNPTRDHYEDECVEWLRQDGKVIEHDHFINDRKLTHARWGMWEATKRILDCRSNDRWMANDQACYDWNKPCPYIDLCDAVQNGADVEWAIEDQFQTAPPNPELAGHDVGEGLPILTHSMMQSLSRCEMYYQWRFERGIVKRYDDDDKDAMWIGSAVHVALDVANKVGRLDDQALVAIDKWADANPVLGEDPAWKQDEQIAKARAMARVAMIRWPNPGSEDHEPTGTVDPDAVQPQG